MNKTIDRRYVLAQARKLCIHPDVYRYPAIQRKCSDSYCRWPAVPAPAPAPARRRAGRQRIFYGIYTIVGVAVWFAAALAGRY